MTFEEFAKADTNIIKKIKELEVQRFELTKKFTIDNCPLGQKAIVERSGQRLILVGVGIEPGVSAEIPYYWKGMFLPISKVGKVGKKKTFINFTNNLKGLAVIEKGSYDS